MDAVVGAWPAGTTVTVSGTIDSRYAQRTLRISELAVVAGSATALPEPIATMTGEATEAAEGVRIRVSGIVTEAPDQLTDGLAITIDDGSGPVRAVIGPDALAGRTVAAGMVATVSGPLGQRDSSGTGAAGYRIHATLPGELELAASEPSPAREPDADPRSGCERGTDRGAPTDAGSDATAHAGVDPIAGDDTLARTDSEPVAVTVALGRHPDHRRRPVAADRGARHGARRGHGGGRSARDARAPRDR